MKPALLYVPERLAAYYVIGCGARFVKGIVAKSGWLTAIPWEALSPALINHLFLTCLSQAPRDAAEYFFCKGMVECVLLITSMGAVIN